MSAAAAAPVESRVTVVSFEVGGLASGVYCADLYAVLKRLGYSRMSLHHSALHQIRSMMLEHDVGVTREVIVRELEKGAGITSFILPKVPVQTGLEDLQFKVPGQTYLWKAGSIYLGY